MGTLLTLKQHAYRFIRKKLEQGEMPLGGRLSDDALAKEIGISRSPVREAISQLASEGLVEYRPRCGAFVKMPDRREMEELYEVRIALESFAAVKAAERATDAQIAELEQLNRDLLATVRECQERPGKIADPELTDRFLASDMHFHLHILRMAGNRKIMAMVEDCKILIRVFAHVPIEHDLRLVARSYREHSSVLRAVRRRDPEAARGCMTDHIATAARLVLRGYNGKTEKPAKPGDGAKATPR
jgi:DNA-binding GntR family transcriptional regulator